MLAMSLAFLPIKISAENVPNIILKSEGERKDFSFDSNWISVTLAAVKNIIFNYANDNLSNFQKTSNNHSDNKNNNDNNNNNNNDNKYNNRIIIIIVLTIVMIIIMMIT